MECLITTRHCQLRKMKRTVSYQTLALPCSEMLADGALHPPRMGLYGKITVGSDNCFALSVTSIEGRLKNR